jgi:hypothetical protein
VSGTDTQGTPMRFSSHHHGVAKRVFKLNIYIGHHRHNGFVLLARHDTILDCSARSERASESYSDRSIFEGSNIKSIFDAPDHTG